MSRYHNDELVQGSLHLLNRFFSSETSLFHSSVQTQLLLTEESKRVSHSLPPSLPPSLTSSIPPSLPPSFPHVLHLCCRCSRRLGTCCPLCVDCSAWTSGRPAGRRWWTSSAPSLASASCQLRRQSHTHRIRRSSTISVSA